MRCYVQPSDWQSTQIILSEEESHHVLHVLRAKPGDHVELFNGAGGEADAVVVSAERGEVRVKIASRSEQPPLPVALVLVQALPREQKMDFIVQKAVELGASAVIPVLTERAVVKLKPDQAAEKRGRWERIALNAAKQSGVSRLPRIETPRPLAELLASRPAWDVFLVGSLGASTRPLRDVLRDAAARGARSAAIAIGPEGDFTPSELDSLAAAGAVPVTFGGSVLRSETAAIYALGAMRYELF